MALKEKLRKEKLFLIILMMVISLFLFFKITVAEAEYCPGSAKIDMDTMKCFGGGDLSCTTKEATSLIRVENGTERIFEIDDIWIDCLIARCLVTNGDYYQEDYKNKLMKCNLNGCEVATDYSLKDTCACPEERHYHPCLGCIDEEIYKNIPEIFNQNGKCLEGLRGGWGESVEWVELTNISLKCVNSKLNEISVTVASGLNDIKKNISIGTFYYNFGNYDAILDVRKTEYVSIPPLTVEEIKISGFAIDLKQRFCFEKVYFDASGEDIGGGELLLCELVYADNCEIECRKAYPDYRYFDCTKNMTNVYIGFMKHIESSYNRTVRNMGFMKRSAQIELSYNGIVHNIFYFFILITVIIIIAVIVLLIKRRKIK